MKIIRIIFYFGVAVVWPILVNTPSRASDEIKLNGSASLNQDYCSKGTTDPECSLSITIEGKAAKLIYDAMPEKGAMQECTGNVEKFNESGMHCIKGKNTNDYICDFGYYFKKHSFGGGADGC